MSDEQAAPGAVVRRDPDRFKRFYPDVRAVIPPGYEAELVIKPTRVLIAERIAALQAAEAAKAAGARP